jgi:class 3 adenylate cyclase
MSPKSKPKKTRRLQASPEGRRAASEMQPVSGHVPFSEEPQIPLRISLPRYKGYNSTQDKVRTLEFELATLKKQFSSTSVKSSREKKARSKLVEDIAAKESLRHLLRCVSPRAQEALLGDSRLVKKFRSKQPCKAFVLSVDIRRSTALMLKAREPQLFATFITSLCDCFYRIIVDNYGVFDKFTGDGILAFFPEFYSGEDSAFYALDSAEKCHLAFVDHYAKNRNCFSSVFKNAGLGIGIDYGDVSLVDLWGSLTVVGAPVVYACRMGGAPATSTLLNQPAYEVFEDKLKGICKCTETEIEIKGEGAMLAYSVKRSAKVYSPVAPNWVS